jgi:phosphate transport system substrate-binding protein
MSQKRTPSKHIKSWHRASSCSFLISILFFIGCGGQAGKGHTDTSTSGVVNIGSDDSYKSIVDAEKQVFQSLYDRTTVNVKYEPEDSLFTDLMRDSVWVIVAGRQLNQQEETYFKDKQLFPEQVKIATDAVALIVNNDNPDTLISIDKIKAILNGDSSWDAPGTGKITVVFDHQNSVNSRYLREKLMNGDKFPANCFALNGNPQVIDYVSKNKHALGVIGVNWVSNDHDSATNSFLNKVKIVWVSLTKDGQHFQPYPYYIKTGDYPLCRDVFMIKTEPYVGLGSGFLSFVTSDKGQRIIFHEGILPATVPTHIISF